MKDALRERWGASIFQADGCVDRKAIAQRVEALGELLGTDEGENLVQGYKRAANILKAEGKKGDLPEAATDGDYGAAEAGALAKALSAAGPKIDTQLDAKWEVFYRTGTSGKWKPVKNLKVLLAPHARRPGKGKKSVPLCAELIFDAVKGKQFRVVPKGAPALSGVIVSRVK